MNKLTQAEQYLLDEIRQGSSEAWSQLVNRYQGRLTAFARRKLRDLADAEDLVQETFIGFLKSLANFRQQASIETYLFAILRRKIISSFRGKSQSICLLQDVMPGGSDSDSGSTPMQLAAPDPTASWYARRDEDHELKQAALADALGELIAGHKKSLNFSELQIVEMLFYCQLRNKDIARIANVSENNVAVIKHRCLKQIRDRLAVSLPTDSSHQPAGELVADLPDTILTEIWQTDRLSCLKRSTIGAYLLGTLEPEWAEYVAFHLDRLGCEFCQANLEDVKAQSQTDQASTFRNRIMQSTVGFLHKT